MGYRRGTTVGYRVGSPGRDVSALRRIGRSLPVLPAIYRRFHKDGSPQQSSRSGEVQQPFQILDDNYRRTGHFGKSNVVLAQGPRPDAMAALVRHNSGSSLIRQVRDERFYAWRYENPFSVYRFLFREESGLQAYLVLRQPVHSRSTTAFVVDWEAAKIGMLAEMLEIVIRHGGFSSIGIWSAGLSGDLAKVLARHGFCPTPSGLKRRHSRRGPSG